MVVQAVCLFVSAVMEGHRTIAGSLQFALRLALAMEEDTYVEKGSIVELAVVKDL